MSENLTEQLDRGSPYYQAAVKWLYSSVDEITLANPQHARFYDNGRETTNLLQVIGPGSAGLITIERTIKQPLPKNVDWSDAVPAIYKSVPLSENQEIIHQYSHVNGLIVDQAQIYRREGRRWRQTLSHDDELSIREINLLAGEINYWDLIELSKASKFLNRAKMFGSLILKNI